MQISADRREVKVSSHFPPEVRDQLVAAARTPVSGADPMARVRRIDSVAEWARAHYPAWFR